MSDNSDGQEEQVVDPVDLLAEIAAVTRRQDDQERVTGEHHDRLENVGSELIKILKLLEDPETVLAPWDFAEMTRDEAAKAWPILIEWVDRVVIQRYDAMNLDVPENTIPQGTKIKQCWFAHPEALDKLAALWWAKKGAYKHHAPAFQAHEFQHVLLQATLDQIDLGYCINGCRHLAAAGVYGMAPDETGKLVESTKYSAITPQVRQQFIDKDIADRPEKKADDA